MPRYHDPTRRNRNLGTPKRGRGRSGHFVVPRSWRESLTEWRGPGACDLTVRHVWGRDLPFRVDELLEDYVHAVDVDDVARVLRKVPKQHFVSRGPIPGIEGIALVQPTRKLDRLRPVWGRLGYGVEVGRRVGPVIFLCAQRLPLVLRWSRRLDVQDARHVERLRHFCDGYEGTRREHVFRFEERGLRDYQLQHTLLHELGHWAEMYEKVELPALDGDLGEWQPLWDRFFLRDPAEREEYANRYADTQRARLQAEGIFEPPS